jgi:hypothetical protein
MARFNLVAMGRAERVSPRVAEKLVQYRKSLVAQKESAERDIARLDRILQKARLEEQQ